MKYEIWWVNVTNGVSGVVPDEYDDERTAKADAKFYDTCYPGIKHYARPKPVENKNG